jgi:hypothetical protein
MTWFWFNRENRLTRWPTTVVEVLGPSTFRVDKGGSRQSVWLRGEGCIGYEYPRQTWIAIGEYLSRYKWFRRWNRPRCPKCDGDVFENKYRDMMDYTEMESADQCQKCKTEVSQYLYGDVFEWFTNRWMQYEEKIFGALPKT